MSLPSKVNKENFRLLDLSSNDDSEDFQLEIIPSRKKKVVRRDRSKNTTPRRSNSNVETDVRCALRWALQGTVLLWLLMLTWICSSLYDQMSVMKTNITRVSTSSDSVGDSLQLCHTAAKELRGNVTELKIRLAALEQNHTQLTQRVEQATRELAAVTNQLAAAPKLVDMPLRLSELQQTVAGFGSQINGFDSGLDSARRLAVSANTGLEEVRASLHQLEARANETTANVTAGAKRDEELRLQVAGVNTTLGMRVDALQAKLQEVSKPASTPAPPPQVVVAASAQTTGSTPTTTTTTTTTMAPPGAPVKRNVLPLGQ